MTDKNASRWFLSRSIFQREVRWAAGLGCLMLMCIAKSSSAQLAQQNPEHNNTEPKWYSVLSPDSFLPTLEPAVASQVKELAQKMQSEISETRSAAATSLSNAMLELREAESTQAAQRIAMALLELPANFLPSETLGKIKRRAFGVLYDSRAGRLPPGTTTVVFNAPNITCHGRFLDSLNEFVRDKTDWIFRVDVVLLPETPGNQAQPAQAVWLRADQPIPFSLTSRATRITFVVDRYHSAEDLVQLIAKTKRYALDNWKVSRMVPVSTLLTSETNRASE